MKVALSFDTDWVNKLALEYVIDLLNYYDQKGTFFATNDYEILSAEHLPHEVGLHPNFNHLLVNGNSNYKQIIDELFEIYPNAKGFRSHSLTTSSVILNYFKSLGLKYDSNIYHPDGAIKFKDFSGLQRFTHNYVDLGHLMSGLDLTLDNIKFSKKNLNIFCFHPIHIYLNIPSLSYYERIKHLVPSEKIASLRNDKQKGIGNLFIDFLEFLKKKKIKTKTLISIVKDNA
tara:strand:+ start:17179 stop:17868 length:690 start_codon:yes stop_codon:yes gene_type:complete